jgi:hypothetical protein
MRITKTLSPGWFFLGTLVILGGFSAAPPRAKAQCSPPPLTAGFNAVYCNSTSTQGTFAMVDASQYTSSSVDICTAIQKILINNGNPNGIVVDARGVNLGQTPTCNVNPWDPSAVNPEPPSSVVLLPSGTITIQAGKSWTLPTNTRVIGQGSEVTFFQAASGLADMIDMGTTVGGSGLCDRQSPPHCEGIGIEHLALVGTGGTSKTNGIVNCCSQELSYVNDVTLSNFGTGTGLYLDARSNNSGPYTNISYSGNGTCVQIYDSSRKSQLRQTRGIHGLTCIMSGSSGSPAVYVDAPNNSLEDVYIQGAPTLQDGILIGYHGAASNNVLFNVKGVGLKNVINLSSANSLSDITILGVTNSGSNATVMDNLNGGATLTDANLGMYIVGEPVQGAGNPIGYSRFTTSTSSGAATWLVGPNSPSGTCPVGDLFSQTSGTGSITLWGCGVPGGGPGTGSWYQIK